MKVLRQSLFSTRSGARLTRRSMMQRGIGFGAAATFPRHAGQQ
jgi:hypothetical protein